MTILNRRGFTGALAGLALAGLALAAGLSGTALAQDKPTIALVQINQ